MIFIFDLDFTIWNCGGTWCDHTLPPYKKIDNYLIEDSEGLQIKLYPESLSILQELTRQKIKIAAASRTGAPEWALQLLKLFNIDKYFTYKVIYPGSKIIHINSIQKETGIKFKDMFFFDDEYRNIDEVKTLGVNCYYVENGINSSHIKDAIEEYQKKNL
jgi:magnesium-dependent phosphatase 1